jgi:hypothetical protein
MAADPAEELDPEDINANSQAEAHDDDKTPGDTTEARQPEPADKAKADRDDSALLSDPLLLAQMEPETTPPAASAKADAKPATPPPTSTSKQPAPKADQKPADAEKPAEQPELKQEDPDEAEALADLPQEDWSKVSHKTRSQFLAQRKVIKAQRERVQAEAEQRRKAEENYQAVEKFVTDTGLEHEEYVNSVAISGMIKKRDPRAIPVLEATLAGLRKATGQPEPVAQPVTPTLDDDLAAVLREAEEMGIDTGKVHSRFQPQAKTPPAAPEPVQTPVVEQRMPPAPQAGGDAEFQAIIDAFGGLGLSDQQAAERVTELLKADPQLANVPAGKRLRAVLAAHQQAVPKAPVQSRPSATPISGRGAPRLVPGRTTTPTEDPLKLALQKPGR